MCWWTPGNKAIYIQYASLKLMPRFRNPSVAGPEFRDKRKCGRPKHTNAEGLNANTEDM